MALLQIGCNLQGVDTKMRLCYSLIMVRLVKSLVAGNALRAMGAMLLGLAGVAVFLSVLDRVYPIGDWLVWSVLPLWGWAGLWCLASLSFGQLLLVRLLKLSGLRALESAVLSMAIGTVGFVLAMYLGGALALLTPGFAVLLPLTLLTFGGYDEYRLLLRLRQEMLESPRTVLSTAAAVFGVVCVGLIYLSIMTPNAVNYDATWYHLRIAQDYARWGRIAPFNDYNSCVPHLASILYTWGYLVPGLTGAQRWMMALHLEFTLLLWTLVGVAAGVQRLSNNYQIKGTWVAFFLFPMIFVYDSNLGGAADHVLAFFSVPILLAALHVIKTFGWGWCSLLAIVMAGAVLTKYQAVYIIAPVVTVVSIAWLGAWIRLVLPNFGLAGAHGIHKLKWAPVVVIGVGTLCVSPHFLKNALFYGNPIYPFMQDVFTSSSPRVPHATAYVQSIFVDPSWIPVGTFWEKLKHAFELFFTFSFKPHYSCINYVPTFGSLFTLLLPGLALLRRRNAIGLAAAVATGSLLIWGITYNVDRNLQTFMPILVCVTGALLVGLWHLGWLARVGLVPLVALQLIWGADAPFLPANGSYCSGSDRFMSSLAFIRSGYEGHAKSRFDSYFSGQVAIGKSLPENAKLLVHEAHLSLGVNRDILFDTVGFQGLIAYDDLHSARELFDYYRSLGITHIWDGPGHGEATRQEAALYYLFLTRYCQATNNRGGRIFAMPSDAPPVEASYQALTLGVHGYADGLYPIERLNAPERLPERLRQYSAPAEPLTPANTSRLLGMAAVVLDGTPAYSDIKSELTNTFDRIQTADGVTVYGRRR